MRKSLALAVCFLGSAPLASAVQVTSTWLSANSGNWSDATNWSTNPEYPRNHSPLGTTYEALINAAGGVYTINFDAGSIALANLHLNAPLATVNHPAGVLWLDSATISAGTYLLNGGTLGGAGNINVYSSMVYNGGFLAGTGSLNIHAGGSLTIGTLSTRIVSRTIANSGTVNFATFSNLTLSDGTFLNSGWTNFNNTSNAIQFSGGTNNFLSNTGTFNINSPTTGFQFNAAYVNSGTINVQAGTVQYAFGSYSHNAGTRFTGNGTLIANAGTMLFNGASTFSTARVFLNGAYLTGPGSITNNTNLQWNAGSIDGGGRFINNATLTIGTLSARVLGRMLVNNGTMNFLDFSGMTLANGTINNNGWINLGAASTPFTQGAGSNNLISNVGTINVNAGTNSFQFYSLGYRNSGTINVQSGTLMYSFGTFSHEDGTRFTGAGTMIANSGSLQFNGDATFTVARARLDSGSFFGAGDLHLESTFDFNGGSFGGGGTAWNTGTLNIGTYSTRYLARTLSNSGIVNFLPGTSLILAGGTFDNRGVVNFNNVSNPFSTGGGTNNLIRNSGTFNFNSPSTTFNLSGSLVNSGTINLQAGTTIFSFGTYSMNAGTRFIGEGTLSANAGTIFFNGASTFSNARTILGGALLRTSDVLRLEGTTDWNAGSITGSGSINNVGTMNIGTLSSKYLANTLVNNGTVNFLPGAQVFLNNGTFINNGYTQWGSPGGFTLAGGTQSFLSNSGTIDLALGSADSYTFPIGYTNSGTINVQAGTLAYNNLNYFFHDPGSRITGAGIVGMNAGTLLFFGDSTITTAQTLFTGARIDGSGTLHLHTGANWSSGTMTGSGTTTIEPGGLLNVVPGGNAVLSRYLVNFGQTTLTTGAVLSLNNGTFVNSSVGTLFINSNPNFFAAPTGLVRNDGTVVVANSDVTITVPFVNNGTVVVGSTPPPGPASAASQLALTNLAQLSNGVLEGGSWVVNDDAQLTLPGNVQDSHAAITLAGSASMPQLAALASNRGTLTLAGGQTFTTSGNLSNDGVLRILTGSQMSITGNLSAAGTVQLQGLLSLTGSSGISAIDHLSVLGGSIDVTRNDLILKGNPATILALITSGHNNGFWDGSGIRSGTALTDQKTLGSTLASDLFEAFPATYCGITVNAEDFIIAYTVPGDSNLDGKVNTIDFNNLAGSFGASGKKWIDGDFDYNGIVDSIDFTQIVSNFGRTNSPAPSLGSVIPEPATVGIVALAMMAMRRRKLID
jgi:hypothetical protein